MSTKARRCSIPVAVRCIGGPPGTITGGPPARPTCLPLRASPAGLPCSVYQALWPACVCGGAVMPRPLKISFHVLTNEFRPAVIGSGPISAMRSPRRPPSLVCNRQQPHSQRLDNDAPGDFCCFSLSFGFAFCSPVRHWCQKVLACCSCPSGCSGDDPTSSQPVRSATRFKFAQTLSRKSRNSTALNRAR